MGSMGSLHAGQRDAGHTTDLRRGTRWITTFKKLPTTRPSKPAARTITPPGEMPTTPAAACPARGTTRRNVSCIGINTSDTVLRLLGARYSTSSRKRDDSSRQGPNRPLAPGGTHGSFTGDSRSLQHHGPQDLFDGGYSFGRFRQAIF